MGHGHPEVTGLKEMPPGTPQLLGADLALVRSYRGFIPVIDIRSVVQLLPWLLRKKSLYFKIDLY